MDLKRVVITGAGVISPVGNSAAAFWESLREGRCGVRKLQGFEGQDLPAHVAAQVRDFDPIAAGLTRGDVRHYDRFCQYAVAAALEAVRASGLESGSNIAPERLGVYVGSGIGGMETFMEQTKVCLEEGARRVSPLFIPMLIANIAGGNIAIKLNAQGPTLASVSACATSTNTVGEAFRAIRYGMADAILAGGSDAVVNPLTIGGFANCHALTQSEDPLNASLPFDRRRGGFVLGEGAAILVLEEYGHARARGAAILAEICGYGNTCDAFHYTAPRADGTGVARAVTDALREADYDGTGELYINAHGTGTLLNDKTETLAFKLALGETGARRASISSTKSMTGHMIGATGAAEILASALALRDGIVPPTIGLREPDPDCDLDYTPLAARERALSWAVSDSLGFGGHNVCVVLKKV